MISTPVLNGSVLLGALLVATGCGGNGSAATDGGPAPDVGPADARADADASCDPGADADLAEPVVDPFDPSGHVCTRDAWCWLHPTPQGNQLDDVWMDEDGVAVAVGRHGTILVHDGGSWTTSTCGVGDEDLHAVWGTSAEHVIAVGDLGSVYRFDGACWERMDTDISRALYAVWGSATDDVYAAGEETLLRFDGSEWRRVPIDLTTIFLSALWGSASDDVYAGGFLEDWNPAPILRFDGERWEQLTTTALWVEALWGSAPDDLYAVGSGLIAHYDGVDFAGTDPDEMLFTIWGRSEAEVLAAGTTIRRLEGGSFQVEANPDGLVYGLAGSGMHPAVAVGSEGLIVREHGDSWMDERQRVTREILHAAWGSSLSDVFVVGWGGTILHFDGSVWTPMESGVTWSIVAVTGTGPDSVYAAGLDASILHYDGSTWHREPVPAWADRWVTSLWATGDDDLYAAVGSEVFHFDGSTWSAVASSGGETLRGISGRNSCDVVAVGDRGVALRFDGSTWSPFGPGPLDTLFAVWVAPTGEVFAVGRDGVVFQHDLERWTTVFRGTGGSARAVWGSDTGDVYVAGDLGLGVVHFDGSSWTPMASGASQHLNGLWGHGRGAVFAVGIGGTILRHRR
jgi:hypothetical protein